MSIFYPVLLLQGRTKEEGESDGVIFRMSSKPFTKWGINGNVIDAAAFTSPQKDKAKKESKDADTNIQNSRKSNAVTNENGEDNHSSPTKFSELIDGCIYDFRDDVANQSNKDSKDDTEVVVRIQQRLLPAAAVPTLFDTC